MWRPTMSRRRGDVIVLCLLLLGIQQLGGAALIQAKAALAQLLIGKAWAQTLNTGKQAVKPWPWADTWPVGRLRVEGLDQELFILEGDTGNALAFGPGRALPSAKLGEKGAAVIGGHRDTHFAFLQQLQKGHVLALQLASGESREYQVSELSIVDAGQESLTGGSSEEALLLVTCYPFDALQAGGPLRYVVTAVPRRDELAVL
jgi:sortase A